MKYFLALGLLMIPLTAHAEPCATIKCLDGRLANQQLQIDAMAKVLASMGVHIPKIEEATQSFDNAGARLADDVASLAEENARLESELSGQEARIKQMEKDNKKMTNSALPVNKSKGENP